MKNNMWGTPPVEPEEVEMNYQQPKLLNVYVLANSDCESINNIFVYTDFNKMKTFLIEMLHKDFDSIIQNKNEPSNIREIYGKYLNQAINLEEKDFLNKKAIFFEWWEVFKRNVIY